jgi:hypothetical protein
MELAPYMEGNKEILVGEQIAMSNAEEKKFEHASAARIQDIENRFNERATLMTRHAKTAASQLMHRRG